MTHRRRIVIFNVKYSPNLGDGVLSECLEHGLREALPDVELHTVDLAGRTAFVAPKGSSKRLAALQALHAMPRALKDLAFTTLLSHDLKAKIGPQIERALESADFAVFGGGQLIQDGDLNFPLKISTAARACRDRDMPMAVFGVGVSRSRSPKGRALLRELFTAPTLSHVAVRDAASRQNLASYADAPATVCHDPGTLAARLWPMERPPSDAGARRRIGLNFAHPTLLRHHASEGAERVDHKARFVALAHALAAADHEVVCFTNGAAEDERFLSNCAEALAAGPGPGVIRVEPRAETPLALCRLIGGLSAVIAHRLHTNIVAFSYGVPHLGLKWDAKVDAFFDKTGRGAALARLSEITPGDIADRARQLLDERISPTARNAVMDEAQADIAALAAAIVQAAPARAAARRMDGLSETGRTAHVGR